LQNCSTNQLNSFQQQLTPPNCQSLNGFNSNQQQQLRSKTPTTDRLLFQHSSAAANNDYIYLNGSSLNQKKIINCNTTPTLTSNKVDTLYSTVNNKNNNNNNNEHTPIYDSTTNIQHQRVISNLNKFNQQLVSNQYNIQQQQQQQQLIANRSKTPGPDVIYFRNNNNINNKSVGALSSVLNNNNNNFNGNSYNTINTATRSKTPTADIMYYPSNNSNSNLNNMPLIKRGGNSREPTMDFFVDSTNLNDYPVEATTSASAGSHQIISDVDGNNYIEMTIDLYKQETGFGFRIVGGEEEGSQVAIGYIVQGGAAHLDGRLRPNDEIIMIDNECVLGATHRRVVQLMAIAGLNRKVKIMIRRQISAQLASNLIQQKQQQQQMVMMRPVSRQQQQIYPYTITLFRNGNEGFGFVIISTINKTGPSIG